MRLTRAPSLLDAYSARVFALLVRREFKRFEGAGVSLRARIDNPQFIEIGKGVSIRRGTWLYAVTKGPGNAVFSPHIVIDDGTYLGHSLHLTCVESVVIEKNVMVADGVYVSDNYHEYRDITVPVRAQMVFSRGPLRIREGAFIGEGARVLGAVTIGLNSIVGCNAVVTSDVPDFCVVGGVPARIVKRYDPTAREWRRVVPEGQ